MSVLAAILAAPILTRVFYTWRIHSLLCPTNSIIQCHPLGFPVPALVLIARQPGVKFACLCSFQIPHYSNIICRAVMATGMLVAPSLHDSCAVQITAPTAVILVETPCLERWSSFYTKQAARKSGTFTMFAVI